MKDIKSSNLLKGICYCIVPILVLIIILNVIAFMFYETYQDDFDGGYKGYASTNAFANDYLNNIMRVISIAENEKNIIEQEHESKQTNKEIQDDTIILNPQKIQYNFSSIRKYDVLLITPSGKYVTNVEKTLNTDTAEEIKQYISSKRYFWKYDGRTVETSVDKLSYDKIAYNGFERIQEKGYQIYMSAKNENNSEFYAYMLMYDLVSTRYKTAPIVIAVCSGLLIASLVYIVSSIGHKKGIEGIYTSSLDKIPYGVIGTITSLALIFEIVVLKIFLATIDNHLVNQMLISTSVTVISIFIGFVMYATLAIAGVTTIRRLKAHIFWKNTIIYKLFKFLFGGLFINLSQTVKIALMYGAFILASGVLMLIIFGTLYNGPFNVIFVLILFAFWYYVFKKILDYTNKMGKIREKIKDMYNGNIEKTLDENELYGELKQVAVELNDISGGLSNAIKEATKSERLKTELITNVSHDIKTPLTSIINYVDLMKKEEIKNPKVKEYLEVLDSKSQRLKKLTEDLIEASKASSGNIKLTMEKLNVKELVKQVGGEFEDKFKEKGLEVIESFPQEEVSIWADSRYMYRVMENMYMNISKYALENSRVYIDVIKTNGKVQIVLKNISKDKLNISVDELMKRFTRGDVARTTEGSGLGISIAKSLTQLQQGKFDICLDGDLFKVVIEFETK